MNDRFSNGFVVKVEHGHSGFTDYKVISTLDGYKELLRVLTPQIEGLQNRLENESNFRETDRLLFSEYATLYPGITSRVQVSFLLDTNLEKYHEPPRLLNRAANKVAVLLWIALALIGLISVARFVFF